MHTSLLTIVIPTFERSSSLEMLLRCLQHETAKVSTAVSVLVIDNCSEDDTPAVIERVKADWPALRSHRHAQNIGADNNFLFGVRAVESRWFWIIGDDDLPKSGIVSQVIALLRSHQPTLLHLRSHWIKTVAELQINRLSELSTQKNKLVVFDLDALSFAKYTNSMVSFISGMVVDRRSVHSALNGQNIDRFNNSNLVQLGWVLPLLARSGVFLYVATQCVMTRIETRGYDSMDTLGISFAKIVREVYGRDHPLEKTLLKKNLIHFLPNLIWMRRLSFANNKVNQETWNHLNEYYGQYLFYKLVILSIGKWPYFFAYPLLQVCRLNSLLYRNMKNISLTINKHHSFLNT